MWQSTKRTFIIATCWVFCVGENGFTSPEGENFFKTLKDLKKDALLVRMVDGALTEEICQKIELSVKEEQFVADSGGNLLVYTLDRSGKDPVTRDLEEKYFFDNIPLAILIDEQGRPVGKTIITDSRKDSLLREIKRMRTLKETRDQAFADSAKSERGYSVKFLDQGLSILPKNELGKYYQKEVQQILQGDDPELVKNYQTILAEQRDRSIVEAALERLRRKISNGNLDLQGVIAFLDEEMSREGLSNEIKQKLEMHKFRYYSGSKNYDKALASLDEAYAFTPKSDLAGRIQGFRERILKAKSELEKNALKPVPKPVPN